MGRVSFGGNLSSISKTVVEKEKWSVNSPGAFKSVLE